MGRHDAAISSEPRKRALDRPSLPYEFEARSLSIRLTISSVTPPRAVVISDNLEAYLKGAGARSWDAEND
jgi:hypothetical protein